MSDGSISVDMPVEPKAKKKKVKSKKIDKAEKKVKKAKATKTAKPKGKARARIDIESGTRKEIKVAEAIYDHLVEFAEKHELKSAGEAADRIISTGIVRKKALANYAKRVAAGLVGKG